MFVCVCTCVRVKYATGPISGIQVDHAAAEDVELISAQRVLGTARVNIRLCGRVSVGVGDHACVCVRVCMGVGVVGAYVCVMCLCACVRAVGRACRG